MAYRVEVTKNAEAELEELYRWVVQRAPETKPGLVELEGLGRKRSRRQA